MTNYSENIHELRTSILFLSFLQILFFVVVFVNIPVAREVVSFVYLTFVPGIMIMNLLGIRKFDNAESILFSAGLSIAFLMIAGLLLSSFGPLAGISQPLSLMPLMLVISSFTVLLAFLTYAIHKSIAFPFPKNLKINPAILLLAIPLILSIAGAYYVNISGDSSVLFVMIIVIVAVFLAAVLSRKGRLSNLYPLILLIISIALLFHFTLISNYIHGPDIQLEYNLFRNTQIPSQWSPSFLTPSTWREMDAARMNGMLSITVLPTIYSNLLNIDATWTFKIVFPVLFSLVPLGCYVLYQMYFEKKIAFISAGLLIFEGGFLLITTLVREMIGELFFVLLLIVLLNKRMNSTTQKVCFAVFGFGLVVSHYAMALIFLFLFSFLWVFLFWKKRERAIMWSGLLALFFSIMFLWYIYTSGAASFDSIVAFGRNISASLGEFFNPASRGSEVLRGLGIELAPSILQTMSRLFAYAVQAFIIVGVIAIIARKTNRRFDNEFVALILLATGLLAMCILIPQFALALQMSRFLHITLLLLAPMFFLGLETLTAPILKRKRSLLILLTLLILVPYFLFQTNFVYAATGFQSWSVPLSISRMGIRPYTIEFCFVQAQDVFGATWLSQNLNGTTDKIYADGPSVMNVLSSYGMIQRDVGERVEKISNNTSIAPNGTIFLSKINVVNVIILTDYGDMNSTDFSPFLNFTNKIYTNGGSEIYRMP